MKQKLISMLAILCVLCLCLTGCGSKDAQPAATDAPSPLPR